MVWCRSYDGSLEYISGPVQWCGAEAMIGAERILVVQCSGVVQKL